MSHSQVSEAVCPPWKLAVVQPSPGFPSAGSSHVQDAEKSCSRSTGPREPTPEPQAGAGLELHCSVESYWPHVAAEHLNHG